MGHVVVAVLDNPYKNPLFNVRERVALLREVFSQDSNIEVDAFSGLLVDYARKKGIYTIIRGVRNPDDLTKELPYAIWNRQLSAGFTEPPEAASLETIYFTAEPTLAHVSGSIVKEVAAHLYRDGLDDQMITKSVPKPVQEALKGKFASR